MPEPNSTAAGLLIGTGIGLTGTILGAQVDALVVGLMAAILVSIWLPSVDNRIKAASAVALSAMASGYFSPHAAAWIATQLALPDYPDSPLRLAAALAIGTVSPAIVPVAITRLQGLVRGG